MAIDLLLNTVIAPSKHNAVYHHEEWEQAEKALGTTLPRDYKQLINAYGACCLCNFIWVFSPFTENHHLNLHAQVKRILDGMQTLQQKYAEERKYPLFPQPGGLLPWGTSDNGDVFYWL